MPLRAVDRQDSEVIGALEVGYNVLPELPDLVRSWPPAWLLIVNREALQASQTTPPSGVQLSEGSDWLLIGHSATQVLHWAQAGVLPEPGSGKGSRLLDADGRSYILNQIPLHDEQQAEPSTPPLAAALAWRDISAMQGEHPQAERRLLIKWAWPGWSPRRCCWCSRSSCNGASACNSSISSPSSSRTADASACSTAPRKSPVCYQAWCSSSSASPMAAMRFSTPAKAPASCTASSRNGCWRTPPRRWSTSTRRTCHACIAHCCAWPCIRSGAVEFRIQHPQRGLLWAEGRASAERLADGTVLWHGFVTEITELMEATRALQKSESRFRAMVGNLPGVVYRCRNDGRRRMSYLSEGIERLTGYPASDFVGDRVRSYGSLIHPDDQAQAEQSPAQDSFERIYRITNAEGRTVYVREKARVLRERDDPVGWCDGFIWDVTDQALAKQEMEERERYLSMLIDNVIDAIIIIDGRGIIETFNHAAEQIFGYRSDEVIGRNLSMLMPEPDRSAHDGYLDHYTRRGTSRALEQNRELTALRRNGETFTIELRVSQISHHGERRFIGLVRDITERKRIERMKSELVSIVSHELRTPLTSISGALGLIVGGALASPRRPCCRCSPSPIRTACVWAAWWTTCWTWTSWSPAR